MKEEGRAQNTFAVSAKKPKGFNSRLKGQKSRSHYGKCGRSHDGVYRVGGSGCYRYRKSGHFSKDCIITITFTHTSELICFHHNQRGHKKANVPILASGGPVLAPAPTTLWITDSRQGNANAIGVRRRSFQLTAKEVCVAPDVVTGMSLLVNSLFMLISLLIFYMFYFWIIPCKWYPCIDII